MSRRPCATRRPASSSTAPIAGRTSTCRSARRASTSVSSSRTTRRSSTRSCAPSRLRARAATSGRSRSRVRWGQEFTSIPRRRAASSRSWRRSRQKQFPHNARRQRQEAAARQRSSRGGSVERLSPPQRARLCAGSIAFRGGEEVKKEDKERLVTELTDRLRETDTLLVADYRGLTMPQIDDLRTKLLEHGARFAVVKNTLTRRAAEAAGNEALLALLEGPTAIAFLESGGDSVAVAKALVDAARDTRVLALRGGMLEGRPVEASEIEALAKLPPVDVLRGQVLGTIVAPLTGILALFTAPLQDLYGLIDARIEQLQAQGDTAEADAQSAESQTEQEEAAPAAEETQSDEETATE